MRGARVGAAAIIGLHLCASRSGSALGRRRRSMRDVPEGRGAWGALFARSIAACALRTRVRARPARTSIERFQQRRRGDARRHRRARRARTASSGPIRARERSSASTSRTIAASRSSISCASRSSCATWRPATTRRRIVVAVDARAGAHAGAAARAVRRRPEAADVARRHRARSGRADAPRLHRQRVARAQDAAHGDQRLRRDAAGPRRRRAAAHALPAADARAGEEHAAPGRRPAHAVRARKRAEPARATSGSPSCRCCSRCRPTRRRLSGGEHQVALDIARCRDGASAAATSSRARSATSSATPSATRRRRRTITLAWRVETTVPACSPSPTRASASRAEYLPRLTERFYRVDRSRSRATGGTGLGLAIVKHVLLRHQAELEDCKRAGKGSTFAVRLPANRVQRASPAGDIPSQLDAPAPLSRPASARPRAHDR